MKLLRDEPLAPHTTLGVGGSAAYYARAESIQDVGEAAELAHELHEPLLVLGAGSNLVIADAGVDALVVDMALRGRELRSESGVVRLTAAAGEDWDELVRFTTEQGLQGFECLSGIPGRVGATPIQNVGAYGQDVSETIQRVQVYDRLARDVLWLERDACEFGYRDSRFKSREPGRYVVVAVDYALAPGAPPALRYPELLRELAKRGESSPGVGAVRSAVLAIRARKSMLLDARDENRRSCGSFFVNPVVSAADLERVRSRAGVDPPSYEQADGRVKLSAAWLIERSALSRGHRAGNVGLSTRHALALVCHDGASANELVAFARGVQARVAEHFGVTLLPEPTLWGFSTLERGLPAS